MSNVIVGKPDYASLLKYIQQLGGLSYDVRPDYLDVINPLGYSFIEISDLYNTETVIELLSYLKLKTIYSITKNSELFVDLGDGFHRHGKNDLAIHSYLISVSISFNSWSDLERIQLIECFYKAYKIDSKASIEILCKIISDSFHDPIYSHGWTSGIINILRSIGKDKESYE